MLVDKILTNCFCDKEYLQTTNAKFSKDHQGSTKYTSTVSLETLLYFKVKIDFKDKNECFCETPTTAVQKGPSRFDDGALSGPRSPIFASHVCRSYAYEWPTPFLAILWR